MSWRLTTLPALLALLAAAVVGATPGARRIQVRRDTTVSACPSERQVNLGWSPNLKTKGNRRHHQLRRRIPVAVAVAE